MLFRKLATRRVAAAAGVSFAAMLSVLLVPSRECAAASKDECVDAHGRGQDLRQEGQLTRARQMFMTCAQSSCPSLIQGDCARFSDELERLLPTVTFGARDGGGETDLPDTTVYVDGTLVTSRLDDGKAYDFDPGKHTVRFVHDDKDTTLNVVLNQGEKGRVLLATFADLHPKPVATTQAPAAQPTPKRPMFPLAVAGLGAAALVTGGVLLGLGMSKIPANCSMSSRDCAAPPGDPVFNDAHSSIALANLGMGVGLGGAALLAGGLIWYFVQPTKMPSTEAAVARTVSPWLGRGAGGVAFIGNF